MKKLFYIAIDELNSIVSLTQCDFEVLGEIELTSNEFKQAKRFNKFNPITREFSIPKQMETFYNEHEELTIQMQTTNNQIQEDTLLGVELSAETNQVVNMTNSDSLLLMEMLLTLDEKLTQLLGQ